MSPDIRPVPAVGGGQVGALGGLVEPHGEGAEVVVDVRVGGPGGRLGGGQVVRGSGGQVIRWPGGQ